MQFDEDALVPDPQVRRELGGISEMTTWRWDRDPEMAKLGWPPAIKIRTRNYRSRRALNEFRERMMQRGIAARQQAEHRAQDAKAAA